MFEKLLSLLPHNPNLGQQLAFYGKRLRAEQNIRRTGLIFIVLAFAVQFFAVISPPQATVAASNNDLINGGFSSAAEAANDCQSNVQNYGTILQTYGITCAKVASAPTITITSTDFNRQLYSMGRLPYGIAGETPVNIAGGTYYVRYLWGWDTGAPSQYQALNVTSTGGQTLLLLYSCGNLTSVGLPQPVTPPPSLTISKTTAPGYPAAGSDVSPGTILGYRITFNNTGGAAQNVTVTDTLPAHTSLNWQGGGGTASYNAASNQATWVFPTIPAGANNDYVDVNAQVNAGTANNTQLCNVGSISSSQTAAVTSNQVCMTVETISAPPPKPVPVPPPAPPATCQYDSSILATSSSCVPCEYNNTITASNSNCKSCEASQSSQDTIACINVHKTAANTTQGLSDANNTTAQPGDNIVYTLYAQNNGKAAVKQYVFQEDLSDVLDYANVTNLNGGTMDANNNVSWPAVTINAGQTATETIDVQVKNPIPQTPTSSSDPGHFDLTMTNVYGNTINIKVPGSTTKTIEAAAASTTLVNTGPGTSLFVGAIIVALAGYFFARARLLAHETTLALQENNNGGA